jgi:hypothetical protein
MRTSSLDVSQQLAEDFRPWFWCVTFLQELVVEDCSRAIQTRSAYVQVVNKCTDDAKETLTRGKAFQQKAFLLALVMTVAGGHDGLPYL